ncbi:potassium transporter [Aestuariivirga litoralis]|uniref:Potassium transporter n=1 Tax=Aestuariivirga litoralis TaxID=2650924 RepID=A0A2W2BQL7_9HYPH|nr:monovalent cation:proton antiporter-2 (CPA2) family protein [Aestuariivirga litoralis]PZF78489.1 potassium transporter [Aestuariivirga litoralis]
MNPQDLLLGAFIYLAAAVIAAPIATRLGLGSVLGYLVAGMIVGPSVLGLIGREGADVMHFAEFGVVVMLFLVGLELQPSKLWELRRPIIGLGGLQVVITAAVIGGGAFLIGFDWKAALATGLILAMSSTAIVLQSLNERGLLKTTAGQSCFSVLLFQDIAVIPILAFLPLLAATQAHDAHGATLIGDLPGWAQTVAVLGAVAIIVLAGRFLTRPLFRLVAETGIREVFVGLALVMVVGIALLMQLVGLSAALGTFLAGVVLAESEYRHELEMDLEPFKGLLLAVFFIAVGAGINFGLLLSQPLLILGLVLGFIAVKLAVLFILARLFGMCTPDASRFAFSLAQGGEFAFVLISFAAGLALLDAEQAGLLVAVVALSMAAAPLLMIFDSKVVQPRFDGEGTSRADDRIEESGTRVIIAGHGRYGMTVGRLLSASGIRAVVLDHDAEQIDALRKFGYKVYYGDASRPDLLEAAGAGEAQALVIAIDDKEKALEIVETARRHFPKLRILARAFDRVHAYRLFNAGVEDVYREVFASSVDMGEQLLVRLGVHPFEAHRAANRFKSHDEKLIRRAARHVDDTQRLIDLARQGSEEIERVLATDMGGVHVSPDHGWEAPDATRGES